MTAPEIRIPAEPVDQQRCKFLVDRPVYQGVRRFASRAEAQGSPLAEALYAIPGGSEIIVGANLVTVVKDTADPWPGVGKAVGVAIRPAPPASPTTSCTNGSTTCSSSRSTPWSRATEGASS